MNKMLLFACSVVLINCSTGPRTGLNCEKLHADSEARLQELRHIFASHQGVNYDLAMRLSPPLKEEVAELDSRVRKQKLKCWPKEKRPIDAEMVLLREELFKVYGKESEEKVEPVAVSRKQAARKPASMTDEVVESVELDSE